MTLAKLKLRFVENVAELSCFENILLFNIIFWEIAHNAGANNGWLVCKQEPLWSSFIMDKNLFPSIQLISLDG